MARTCPIPQHSTAPKTPAEKPTPSERPEQRDRLSQSLASPDSSQETTPSSVQKAATSPARKVEQHPLAPFLPAEASLLMLGSFPPDRKRWSMEFYYPNLENDMWRIFGVIFFGDRDHFLRPGRKAFDRERLVDFLSERGIALCDTAQAVVRQRGNASDKFLEVVERTDLTALLAEIPCCRTIVTTGQKATETLLAITGATEPPMGGHTEFSYAGRVMRHYRMPSSSRAYPRPLEAKAEVYARMFRETGILK